MLEIPLAGHLQFQTRPLGDFNRDTDSLRLNNPPKIHEIVAGLRINLEIVKVEVVGDDRICPARLHALLPIDVIHDRIGLKDTEGGGQLVEASDSWLYRDHVRVCLRHVGVPYTPEEKKKVHGLLALADLGNGALIIRRVTEV